MKNEKRKKEILDTGLRLFFERGFNNVSVMDICKECHITKPTFYKYVPSKEEILLHHYSGTLEDLLRILRNMDPEPNYWRLIILGLTFTLRKSAELGPELYSHYMSLNFRAHRLSARYNSPARDATIQSIKKAQELGQIKNQSDAIELYLAARNLGLGLALKWCMVRGGYDIVAQTEEKLTVIFEPDFEVIERDVAAYREKNK